MHKPKVLIFVDYYLPGFRAGGPIKSIANLVNALQQYYEFHIITRNHDFASAMPYAVPIGVGVNLGSTTIYYLDRKHRGCLTLYKFLLHIQPQVVYFNSFFSWEFSVKPLLLVKLLPNSTKKIVLAPRGELTAGALQLKAAKKSCFILIAKILQLHSKISWHATSTQEQHDIAQIIRPSSKALVIKNILQHNAGPQHNAAKLPGYLKIVFISRISRKKNLKFALAVINKIQHGNIIFDIYGILEDQVYWQECQELIKLSPDNIQIRYKGEVSPSEVIPTFARYHLFFFPTYGENFGHVILESLQAGCLILTSDQTPWQRWYDQGFFMAANLADSAYFINKITAVLGYNALQFLEFSQTAMQATAQYFNLAQQDIANYHDLFTTLDMG